MRQRRVVIFLNDFGIGGTEKAACTWAGGLKTRGYEVHVMTLANGPRSIELDGLGIPWEQVSPTSKYIARRLAEIRPAALHVHSPGYPHQGDVLAKAVLSLSDSARPRVVQTNIFGRLEDPNDDNWIDFRLFVSWTSCVQAARRAGRRLDPEFFIKQSVAVYPVHPALRSSEEERISFRTALGISSDEVVFGRFGRPDPQKWLGWVVAAFRRACALNPLLQIRLLIQEPPAAVAESLRNGCDSFRFIILPTTPKAARLKLTMEACDAILHGSLIGESFGYGIAEPMSLAIPVVTHSIPWGDQCQLELVRDGETGIVANSVHGMAKAIVSLAGSSDLRATLGKAGLLHIINIADPSDSLNRVESALFPEDLPRRGEQIMSDLRRATQAADNLDQHEYGHSPGEQAILKSRMLRVRFGQARQAMMKAVRMDAALLKRASV